VCAARCQGLVERTRSSIRDRRSPVVYALDARGNVGHGTNFAVIAARIIRATVLGKTNRYARSFAFDR
jgi:hypothetical protein